MFTHIAKLVPKALNKSGLSQQAQAALMCARYRKIAAEILPPEIYTNVWPKFYKNKILILGVSHPAYAQEIAQQKHKLMMLINKSFNKTVLKDIRTVVGEKSIHTEA